MKSKLIALCLFVVTGTAVLVYPQHARPTDGQTQLPAPAAAAPRVEVVFVLDTTGSMGGLIQTAKEKIWSIATTMASAQPAPEIRVGLVAYRDRGDAYVTRVTDLSTDLDSVYASLMDYRAEGGGDGPESVNAALAAAVDQVSWSKERDVYRVVFLVGDAPPHMDYQDEEPYTRILGRARSRGVVINTIRCGNSPETAQTWQQIAALAHGDYFTVEQSGGAVAVATPYDAELAHLSAAVDETRLFFGDAQDKARGQAKAAATDKLSTEGSVTALARRAEFNASASGQRNAFGELDLLSALESGRVELDSVEDEALPEVMQPMAPAEREAYVARQADKRKTLQARIGELSRERDAYIKKQMASRDDLGDSLDYQLFESLRDQAAKKGLRYEADAPKL